MVEIVSLSLDDKASGLDALVRASVQEGYVFVQRLQCEWSCGSNRFDQPGEALFGARLCGTLVAVCGLNRDPYTDDAGVARLRHLYVDPTCRNKHIGRLLVQHCIDVARLQFVKIRLRMARADTDKFYQSLGFIQTNCPQASHQLIL